MTKKVQRAYSKEAGKEIEMRAWQKSELHVLLLSWHRTTVSGGPHYCTPAWPITLDETFSWIASSKQFPLEWNFAIWFFKGLAVFDTRFMTFQEKHTTGGCHRVPMVNVLYKSDGDCQWVSKVKMAMPQGKMAMSSNSSMFKSGTFSPPPPHPRP